MGVGQLQQQQDCDEHGDDYDGGCGDGVIEVRGWQERGFYSKLCCNLMRQSHSNYSPLNLDYVLQD